MKNFLLNTSNKICVASLLALSTAAHATVLTTTTTGFIESAYQANIMGMNSDQLIGKSFTMTIVNEFSGSDLTPFPLGGYALENQIGLTTITYKIGDQAATVKVEGTRYAYFRTDQYPNFMHFIDDLKTGFQYYNFIEGPFFQDGDLTATRNTSSSNAQFVRAGIQFGRGQIMAYQTSFNVTATNSLAAEVPEPNAALLLLIGVAGLALVRSRTSNSLS